ncbi:hypothetical protein ABK040_009024 [Willaertia magna]
MSPMNPMIKTITTTITGRGRRRTRESLLFTTTRTRTRTILLLFIACIVLLLSSSFTFHVTATATATATSSSLSSSTTISTTLLSPFHSLFQYYQSFFSPSFFSFFSSFFQQDDDQFKKEENFENKNDWKIQFKQLTNKFGLFIENKRGEFILNPILKNLQNYLFPDSLSIKKRQEFLLNLLQNNDDLQENLQNGLQNDEYLLNNLQKEEEELDVTSFMKRQLHNNLYNFPIDNTLQNTLQNNYDKNHTIINPCDKTSIFIQYNQTLYFCNDTKVTEQQYNRFILNNEVNHCYKNITMDNFACICPLDRVGSFCNVKRGFECFTKLIDPIKNCTKTNVKVGGIFLDGDFPCLQYTLQKSLQENTLQNNLQNTLQQKSQEENIFKFILKCKFNELPDFETTNKNLKNNMNVTIVKSGNITTIGEIRDNFKYFFKSDDFTMTKPINSQYQFKIFNFNKLSDNLQRYQQVFNKTSSTVDNLYNKVYNENMDNNYENDGNYFIGKKNITFSLPPFHTIDKIYFTGNRLYLESGFQMDTFGGGLNKMEMERFFIDFYNLEELPTVENYRNLIIGLVVPFGSILVLSAFSFLVVFCYFKKQKEKNFLQSE